MISISSLPPLMVLVLAAAAAEEKQGMRVLVLLDDMELMETHSAFFGILADQGFELTFKVADDPSIVFRKYGVYFYDHLVLFCPSVQEFGGDLSARLVAQFIDVGGNVFAAASSDTEEVLREIAAETGFEAADEQRGVVIDHVNFDAANDEGKHTLIVADPKNLIDAPAIVGSKDFSAPLLYRGTGLTAADASNPFILEILTASASAYCHNPDKPVTRRPHSVGKRTLLLAGLQARNNARVVFSGSLEFFSDDFFAAAAGNQDLAAAMVQWCFKRSGLLRVVDVNHHLIGADDPKPPASGSYTVGDEVFYTIKLEEWKGGKWKPYVADDVQMEFVRIVPFVRITLKKDEKELGRYECRFKLPDVFGVYTFTVDYDRPGMTRLLSATRFTVRPLRHDQYERFIPCAYPYYASSFSMMIGVFLLSIVFLHSREEKPKRE